MKLLGKDVSVRKVMSVVEERLAARGLSMPRPTEFTPDGVEARVDPLSFNLRAMEENADATRGLPVETHRDGLSGRAVTLAKQVFRRAGQVFINEALGRQVVFNGHVLDSYAQLSAEVMRLRQRVAELESLGNQAPLPPQEKGEPPTRLKAPRRKRPVAPPPPPPSAPRARNTRRGK